MNIGIDIDEVVARFVPYYLEYHNKKRGDNKTIDDLTRYNFQGEIGVHPDEFDEDIFFLASHHAYRNLKPVEGAKEGVRQLVLGMHNVYFITSRVCALDTVQWLKDHDIKYHNLFCVKQKWRLYEPLGLDVMVDDHYENLKPLVAKGGLGLLYEQPWNKQVLVGGVVRVKNWDEILSRVKKQEEIKYG